ncbi:MAG: hypothetical protein Q9226_007172 [Calogaya cf. arnoldii]
MTGVTNASGTSPEGVKTQDEEKKSGLQEAEVTHPSMTLLEGKPSIAVAVGADDKATTWNLPKRLLTHISSFFEAALSGPWLESTTESLNLPEDDPDAFRFFLHWLFSWMLCKPGEYPKLISPDATRDVYVKAWVLGDKLGCPRFQDFAYAHLHGVKSGISGELFESIYGMTPVGSKLRLWATIQFVEWIKADAFETGAESLKTHWSAAVAAIEDLAADVVTFQIQKTKQTKADLVLVSKWEDFVFPKS